MKNKEKDLTYEEAIEELKEIIEELEGDGLSLDESVGKFKRGIVLYNYCNTTLNDVEGEVKILLGKDTELNEELFELEV